MGAAFVTLAAPHVGARQMGLPLRLGARFVGKIFSTAYDDLLLGSDVLDKICSEQALAPISRFYRRVLYACARKDHLVAFETGTLVVPTVPIDVERFPPFVPGFPHVRCALLLEPFELERWDA